MSAEQGVQVRAMGTRQRVAALFAAVLCAAPSAADERAFVTNQSAQTVSVVALPQMAVLATLPVAGKPAGVAAAPDGRHVYVSSPEGAFVTVLGTDPPAVLRPIALEGGPLGIAVHPDGQGQGVGHALMAALCDWADHWGQVLRIELTVFVDNTRALALYRRIGCVDEGTFRPRRIPTEITNTYA